MKDLTCKAMIYTDSGIIEAQIAPNHTILEILETVGIAFTAPCGGKGQCGKCRIFVSGDLSSVTPKERLVLTDEDLKAGIRLACEARALGDVDISLKQTGSVVLIDGENDETFKACNAYRKKCIEIPEANLEDQRSDEARLLSATQADNLAYPVLQKLTELNKGKVWAVLKDNEVVDISRTEPIIAGAAVDIGTTTIAVYLLDLCSGRIVDTISDLNPQRSFGADVISRCEYAQNENGLKALQKAITDELSGLIGKMLSRNSISNDQLMQIQCTGNTVMMHLLMGVSPASIAVSPFAPVFTNPKMIKAAEFGIPFKNADLCSGSCVAGYIGADTTAAVLASSMAEKDESALLIDIGTNGEIALGNKDHLYCCSAAAGPAFEGAHITCGSGAVDGAVSSVQLHEDGQVEISTIGGKSPASICGSGLVDAISAFIDREIVDETGRFDEDNDVFADRFFKSRSGLAFALTDDHTVYITQKDIREVQLAKAAIAAAIQILMEESGKEPGDIDTLYLAGGFGNYINVHSACNIGLLPHSLEKKVKPIGNAAGTGAKQILINRDRKALESEIAGKMQYIELSAQKEFTALFAENMYFESDE